MGSQLRTRMGICPLIARLNCCTFALPISLGASRTPVVGRWTLAGVRHLRWGMDPLCVPDAIAMGMQSVLSLPDRCEETTGGYDEGFRRGMAGNAHFVLPRSRRAAFWQDIAEMYPRTAFIQLKGCIISLFRHNGLSEGAFQRYLARNVGFPCPSVQNEQILPPSRKEGSAKELGTKVKPRMAARREGEHRASFFSSFACRPAGRLQFV